MVIRKCRKEDMAAILHLVIELAIFEKEPDAVKAQLSEYEENFENNVFDCFVSEIDGEVVGVALYYPIFSTWDGRSLYLEDFVVKERYRMKGFGKELFKAFIEEARRQGCRKAKWQVLDWNSEAVAFYEKIGANIEKGWWNGKIYL